MEVAINKALAIKKEIIKIKNLYLYLHPHFIANSILLFFKYLQLLSIATLFNENINVKIKIKQSIISKS